MNPDAQITPTTGRESRLKIQGPLLFGLRAAWIAYALFALIMFVIAFQIAVPAYIETPLPPLVEDWSTEEVFFAFAEAGLTPESYVYTFGGLDTLFFIVSGGIGLLVFLRRSDDWMGLLTSFVLYHFGVMFSFINELPIFAPQHEPYVSVMNSIFLVAFILFLLVFPDGRFVPNWMRYGFVFIGMYSVGEVLIPALSSVSWNEGIGAFITLGIWGLPAFSQGYRFRHNPRLVVRQQIKWLALTLGSMFVIFLVVFSALALVPWLSEPGGTQLIIHDLLWMMILVPIFMVPISVGIAITRYRLWDIDIVINRSIVYALVTLFLGMVFAGGFFGIRALIQATLGGDQPLYPVILSAIVVAGLFTPASRRLRRFVDRRLYGIDVDYSDAARHEEALRKSMAQEEPVSSFGKYKALGLVGRGGMGEVYRAKDPDSGNEVAIKTLYIRGEGHKEELVKRFRREAKAIEELKHDNIVKLFDYGEEGEVPYMVMEFIHGEALSRMIRGRGRLALEVVLPVAQGIAAALDYAHGQGIVHRDIKPSNVIVEQLDGKPPRAVLMDFGIARMVSAMTALTGTGGMVGTLDYISPEQIQGSHQVDGRADVYSLGVMAYQMMTGELPFKQRNPGALIMAHLSTPPPDAREIVKDLPRRAAKAIQKAMAKEAEDRFERAGEFVEEMGNS